MSKKQKAKDKKEKETDDKEKKKDIGEEDSKVAEKERDDKVRPYHQYGKPYPKRRTLDPSNLEQSAPSDYR